MPNKDGQTSVFRVFGLTREYIRHNLALTARQDKEAKCAGHFKIKNVLDVNLEIDPNNNPERHADIIAWPPEKEEQKSIAQELANCVDFEPYQ